MTTQLGLAGRLAKTFLNSKLTPLFIATSLAIGIFAIAVIPREEDPQILVPMLDITTAMPGASPAEVEQRVTAPIETLVHQISGVEYVYSTSSPGQSLVIVRFLVGTPQEDALIKVYSKLYSNFDLLPPGASQPIIKARSIDDVPILAMTLWGAHYDGYPTSRHCRRGSTQHRADPRCVGNDRDRRPAPYHARGAEHRETERLWPFALNHCGPLGGCKCQPEGRRFLGEQQRDSRRRRQSLRQRARILNPLWSASITDDPSTCATWRRKSSTDPPEPANYVIFGTARLTEPQQYPAVTVTVAKRKGTNATDIANAVLASVHRMQGVHRAERRHDYHHAQLR